MGGQPESGAVGRSLLEALKEPGRLVALALVSWLGAEGFSLLLDWVFGTRLDPFVKAQIIGVATVLLRSLDRFLHELGKETETKFVMGHEGLVPF